MFSIGQNYSIYPGAQATHPHKGLPGEKISAQSIYKSAICDE